MLPGPAIAPALDQLAPDIYGAGLMAARGTWYEIAGSVTDQLAARRAGTAAPNATPGPHGITVWVNGLGQFADVGASGGAPGYHTSVGGAVAGADYAFAPSALVGFAVGGGGVQTSSNGATNDGAAVQFAVYGGYQAGSFFADAQGGYIHVDQNVRRAAGSLGLATRGEGGVNGGGAQLEGGVTLNYDRWRLEPLVGLGILGLSSSSVAERSDSFLAQQISSHSITSVQSLAGVRVGTQFAVTPSMPMNVHALVGWMHEFSDTTAVTTAAFQLIGAQPFSVTTAPIARDAARLSAGADLAVASGVSIYGSYTALVGANTTAQYLTGGVRVVW